MIVLGRAGTKLIQGFEKLELTAYQDERGIWTIGYGHTGPEVKKGLVWTLQQAADAFTRDTEAACEAVSRLVTAPLNQNQADALVSFVFNLGPTRLEQSTLLRRLNARDYAGASAQFPLWVHAGPFVSEGLVRRRAAERELFDEPL